MHRSTLFSKNLMKSLHKFERSSGLPVPHTKVFDHITWFLRYLNFCNIGITLVGIRNVTFFTTFLFNVYCLYKLNLVDGSIMFAFIGEQKSFGIPLFHFINPLTLPQSFQSGKYMKWNGSITKHFWSLLYIARLARKVLGNLLLP